MYLLKNNQTPAADFLNSSVWADVKRCLLARRPVGPDAKDDVHVAAGKGHQRFGFELAIAEIEKLPFDFEETPTSPFDRPAVSITED